jgi:ABC-type transport system involved in multi-copper enzyme maturation permease subunit
MSVTTQESSSPVAETLGWTGRVDRLLERGGERLNPILVKESRQALKSKQFVVTFSLLLLCGWAWSLLGVALLLPGIYYSPSGPFLLVGYYYILTVPMLLIVPFAAYRSLASEREDGTYELLSITTLSARQIVTGKLGSALLQMMVYYSALAPCIAFTYLLGGIDIITILLILIYTFLVSVLLSAVGLMVATATRARHVQLLLSVLLLLALAFVTVLWCIGIYAFIEESGRSSLDAAEIWVAQAAMLTGYATYVVLFTLAAAAQLSFASDNRSTRLRVIMLAQQVLFTGWMLYFWFRYSEHEVLYVLVTFSAIHWMVMGALMTGEWAQLSPRVARSLPQSVLGRAFLTWFNPGSGTGYVFAAANLVAAVLLVMAANAVAAIFGLGGRSVDPQLHTFAVLVVAYVTAYLGVGRLVILWLRRFFYFGLLLPALVHIVLALLGAAVPTFIQAWVHGFADFDRYTVLQTTNWFWSLIEAADGNVWVSPAAPVLLCIGAVGIFAVNLAIASQEVKQVRQETPDRIRQDEIELHPERLVREEKPRSPFAEEGTW